MNCNEFEQQLDAHIGKRLLGTMTKLSEHASQCRQCAETWNGYLRLEESLSQWNSNLPEIDIVESVISLVNKDFRQASSNVATAPQLVLSQPEVIREKRDVAPLGRSYVLAVATVVLMLATGLFLSQSSDQRPAAEPLFPVSVAVVTPPDTSNNHRTSPEIQSFVKDAGVAYYSLAQNAVDVFADASLLVPDSEIIHMPTLLQSGNMPQPLDDLMETIGNDVKPIQSDLRKAIDFLLTSVPDQAS